jgi:hypothetical protein
VAGADMVIVSSRRSRKTKVLGNASQRVLSYRSRDRLLRFFFFFFFKKIQDTKDLYPTS